MRKANLSLPIFTHSIKHRVRYYDYINYRIEKELRIKQQRRNQLAKDDIKLNIRWSRRIIMEKDFDNKLQTGEFEEHIDLPKSKNVQIISPPENLSERAKAFAPPRTTAIFQQKWYQIIDDVVRSPRFKKSHIAQLELLCEMYEDLENCMRFIRENGYSYLAMSSTTRQSKAYPEVAIVLKLRTEIRNMYKQLGLAHGREAVIPNDHADDWE